MIDKDILKKIGLSDELAEHVLDIAKKVRRSAEAIPQNRFVSVHPEVTSRDSIFYRDRISQPLKRNTFSNLQKKN